MYCVSTVSSANESLRPCIKHSPKTKNIKTGMWDEYINIFALYNLISYTYKNWLKIYCEHTMVHIFWISKFKIYFFLISNIRRFILLWPKYTYTCIIILSSEWHCKILITITLYNNNILVLSNMVINDNNAIHVF